MSTIKNTVTTAEDMARKVWLAGLGAYGKSYDEVSGRIDAMSAETNSFFEELIAKGEKLEAQGKEKVESAKNDVVEKANIDSRIESVRTKLGLSDTNNDQKIEELSAKVDALTQAVALLSAKSETTKA